MGNELQVAVDGPKSAARPDEEQLKNLKAIGGYKYPEMVNTTQSVISRLEDADYEGHSLSMLSRVAQALNREVKIDLVPIVPDLDNATLPRPLA